jgi:hypothetical protein
MNACLTCLERTSVLRTPNYSFWSGLALVSDPDSNPGSHLKKLLGSILFALGAQDYPNLVKTRVII